MLIADAFSNPKSPSYYPLRWLVIVFIGFAVYGQTFGFGFVFDDHLFIVTNQAIRDPGKFWDMWSSFPLTRLVGMATFALNYALHQLRPAGYHVFNVLVHLASTFVVWGVAGLFLTIRPLPGIPERVCRELAFAVALLFLVHPGQTQAVTYISQRFESLAAFFYLSTVYGYTRARTTTGMRRIAFWAVTVLFLMLGILSKETAFTIPFMLLLVEVMIIRPERAAGLLQGPRMALFFVGALLFAVVWIKLGLSKLDILFSPVVSESHDGDVLTPVQYGLTQMRVFLTFARLLVFPTGQNLDYDYPMSKGLFDPPLTLLGAGLIAGMILLVIKLRRRFPLAAFGGAWMLVTFSINLVPRPNVIFEHKLYLISFGFLLAAVAVLAAFVRNPRKLFGVLLTVILIFAVASALRNRVWASEESLWKDTIEKSPSKARVYANLSRIYSESGRDLEALALMDQAVVLRPNEYLYYVNRGILFSRLGRKDEALADFNKAVSLSARNETYTARAEFYLSVNSEEAALADLAEAIRIYPNIPNAYLTRGSLWLRKGRYREAMDDLNRALLIAPNEYGALINRGAVNFSEGRYEAALADFTRAQLIGPSDLTHKNRGYCFLALSRVEEARIEFAAALRLNPADEQTRLQYQKIKDMTP